METIKETKSFKVQSNTGKIKIGDLAVLSGVSKSTIHHYLKLGLLHPPKKMGPKQSIFSSSHLLRLNRIRELRQQDRMPLAKIKQLLSNEKHLEQETPSNLHDTASLIRDLEEKKQNKKIKKDDKKRLQIIDAAIALFSKIGYEKTTLEAIAESLHIAKSTVYLYFENKDQLFMKCIDRLTFAVVPEEAWEEIRREKNFLIRIKKRAIAFHNVFPHYKGILTMIKAALGSENHEMSEKAKKALFVMTKPIKKDIRRAISAGFFKDMNEDIIAHLLIAMGEGLGFRCMLDSQYTGKEAVDIMFEFVSHGILKDPSVVEEAPNKSFSYSAEVTDIKDNKTIVKEINFEGTDMLPVKIGEARINLLISKIGSLTFSKNNTELSVQIKGLDGQISKARVLEKKSLSGVIPFGEFSIDLKHVKQIIFNRTTP